MESKNVILAVLLSTIVLIFWSTFFGSPVVEKQTVNNEVSKNESIPTPSIDKQESKSEINRSEVIGNTDRVLLENKNIKGSISLEGGIIDDVIFKNYKKTLNSEDKVTFLNPRKFSNEYFIESGWSTSANEQINLPLVSTLWKIKGNNYLTPNNPVELEWDNGQGLIFKKIITLDDKFLFKITQKIKNNSDKSFQFYPYAQITRKGKPEGRQIYILHEGFLGVFGDQLVEKDYGDIEEEKFTANVSKGWLGITDKYWMTVLIPEKGKNFKSTFQYKDAFKANYIINDPVKINASSNGSSNFRLFVAAKEVNTIDTYAETQKINKLDLVIDWGWFYFFTKPLFFVIDYLFKFSGNFGIAIVLITLAIRALFFPLANFSFRSMAKMKAVTPEMTRLKELHKDDKVKLQQEMMALYRKEKINPAAGCLPVLIQIPFFFAIYKMLFISLEMRHQPFFGWIQDLSAADPTSIFNLFGLIPWDPPSFMIIGIWPILMGASMWVQQKLNPAPTDPIQAKIFAFFPLFLTIILASFPSGLVVYWTVNNILTITQQWVINKNTTVKTN